MSLSSLRSQNRLSHDHASRDETHPLRQVIARCSSCRKREKGEERKKSRLALARHSRLLRSDADDAMTLTNFAALGSPHHRAALSPFHRLPPHYSACATRRRALSPPLSPQLLACALHVSFDLPSVPMLLELFRRFFIILFMWK